VDNELKAQWIITAGKEAGVSDPSLTRYWKYSLIDLDLDRNTGPFIFEDLESQATCYQSELINSNKCQFVHVLFEWN